MALGRNEGALLTLAHDIRNILIQRSYIDIIACVRNVLKSAPAEMVSVAKKMFSRYNDKTNLLLQHFFLPHCKCEFVKLD